MILNLAVISCIYTKGTGNKRKNRQIGFHKKCKNCISNNILEQKKQPTQWEKIFAQFNIQDIQRKLNNNKKTQFKNGQRI